MAKRRKIQKNRKQPHENASPSRRERTRREVIVNTMIAGVVSTVAGNEIPKYMPGPTPTVAAVIPAPAASLTFSWGTPTPTIQGNHGIPSAEVFGRGGSVTNASLTLGE